jgi:HSP20 family protein
MAKRKKLEAPARPESKMQHRRTPPRRPAAKRRRATALVPRQRTSLAPSTPPGATRSPFAIMRQLAEEMDRLFEDMRLGVPPRFDLELEAPEIAEAEWLPSVEVTEHGGRLVVRADLPGLTKDDVHVEVCDDAISIRGERLQEREDQGKGSYRSERSYGSFYREILLPDGIDPDRATASFRNGVLEVTLPAPPRPAKSRTVPIDAG